MEVKEFQKKCADIVDKIDKKYGIDRNPQLAFTQLIAMLAEMHGVDLEKAVDNKVRKLIERGYLE